MLTPGTLREVAVRRTREALADGTILPIPTSWEIVESEGVRFVLRVIRQLREQEAHARGPLLGGPATPGNPFLPYDPAMFVADVSETHVCLLNKFNVLEHHLLIVTREFEEQEALLTGRDFHALDVSLAEIDGLVFYNGGPAAGASQRHKHLQLVPRRLAEGEVDLPIASLFETLPETGAVTTIDRLPFVHAAVQVELGSGSPESGLRAYRRMLEATGIASGGDMQGGPYNLLATRRWMLLVPRERESFEGISINSLGFAGALLARDQRELELLRAGPMLALREVAL
jgi:ATP adenylyltransferase